MRIEENLGISSTKPLCFVVSPIGDAHSPTRKHADYFLKYIVREALDNEFNVIRADEDEPGIIDNQILLRLKEAQLVVADLSGHNPNVFYELAIRQVLKLPFIQMIGQAETIPFDVARQRTIRFDLTDLHSVETACAELKEQARTVTASGYKMRSIDPS